MIRLHLVTLDPKERLSNQMWRKMRTFFFFFFLRFRWSGRHDRQAVDGLRCRSRQPTEPQTSSAWKEASLLCAVCSAAYFCCFSDCLKCYQNLGWAPQHGGQWRHIASILTRPGACSIFLTLRFHLAKFIQRRWNNPKQNKVASSSLNLPCFTSFLNDCCTLFRK